VTLNANGDISGNGRSGWIETGACAATGAVLVMACSQWRLLSAWTSRGASSGIPIPYAGVVVPNGLQSPILPFRRGTTGNLTLKGQLVQVCWGPALDDRFPTGEPILFGCSVDLWSSTSTPSVLCNCMPDCIEYVGCFPSLSPAYLHPWRSSCWDLAHG
jgi:hypothetical protein